jgi:hypothetical protein
VDLRLPTIERRLMHLGEHHRALARIERSGR